MDTLAKLKLSVYDQDGDKDIRTQAYTKQVKNKLSPSEKVASEKATSEKIAEKVAN